MSNCTACGMSYPDERKAIGYDTCTSCGEVQARKRKHCIAPMHKSNYMVITNLVDLKGLNNKGGKYG
jgi:predicted RNA-binding Zn-ribbon protein involved in translation (DUF1610 family)